MSGLSNGGSGVRTRCLPQFRIAGDSSLWPLALPPHLLGWGSWSSPVSYSPRLARLPEGAHPSLLPPLLPPRDCNPTSLWEELVVAAEFLWGVFPSSHVVAPIPAMMSTSNSSSSPRLARLQSDSYVFCILVWFPHTSVSLTAPRLNSSSSIFLAMARSNGTW